MEELSTIAIIILIILCIWTIFWKAYSVWTSARMGHRKWFFVLLVLNTIGILDIFYLIFVAKKTPEDIIKLFKIRK